MKKRSSTIDFHKASYDDIDTHGMRLLIYGAPELSAVLRGHMLIERVLETLIEAHLKRPARLMEKHRLTFELKADLASALGIIPDNLLGAAKALNNIRNSYAHHEEHKLTLEELNSLKVKWAANQKKAFAVACSQGLEEAAQLAIIFLYWSFLNLLPQATHIHAKP
jgi:hypothetical protein